MARKISAYETSDKKIFKSKREADAHEKMLDAPRWIPQIPEDIEDLIAFDGEGRVVGIAVPGDMERHPATNERAEEFMEEIGIEMSVVWSGDENVLKSWGSNSLSKIVVFGPNNFEPATVKDIEWAWKITRDFAKVLNERLITPPR